MNQDTKSSRVARWFLVVAYGLGSPAFGVAEALTGVFSARFDYSPEFIYFVSVTQFCSALLLALGRFRLASLCILTVMSLGAIYSHFKIGSPWTALPSTAFTVIQVWYGYLLLRSNQKHV